MTSLLVDLADVGCPFYRLVGRRVAADGQPIISQPVGRRVAAANLNSTTPNVRESGDNVA